MDGMHSGLEQVARWTYLEVFNRLRTCSGRMSGQDIFAITVFSRFEGSPLDVDPFL